MCDKEYIFNIKILITKFENRLFRFLLNLKGFIIKTYHNKF